MSFTFRPAVREQTPLIIGLAGPTKSGKTYSALRLATGLAGGGTVAMINTEGARGHLYADTFRYLTVDLGKPFRPERYIEALEAAAAITPAVLVIDSLSHMHDGPGGMLEYHEDELDRMGKTDQKARDRSMFTAWIRPKAEENRFIYALLAARCPVILCFRAKEKLRLVPGKEPIDLGWQPITGERIAFETIFTLMFPPHSSGVPDLSLSDMRSPFDAMVPAGKQVDEQLGRVLAEWAKGGAAPSVTDDRAALVKRIKAHPEAKAMDAAARFKLRADYCGGAQIEEADPEALARVLDRLDQLTAVKA